MEIGSWRQLLKKNKARLQGMAKGGVAAGGRSRWERTELLVGRGGEPWAPGWPEVLMSRVFMDGRSQGWWKRSCRGRRKENGEGRAAPGSRGAAPAPSGPGWLVEGKGRCSFSPSRGPTQRRPLQQPLWPQPGIMGRGPRLTGPSLSVGPAPVLLLETSEPGSVLNPCPGLRGSAVSQL